MLRIATLDVAHVELEQADKSWRISLGNIPTTLTSVVRVSTEDGQVGYGVAPIGAQLISGESHAGVQEFVDAVRGAVVGADALNLKATVASIQRVMAGNPRAKTGVESALYDVVGRALGVPVNVLLGGRFRESVDVLRIVAVATPEVMADRTLALAESGFRFAKLKLSGDVGLDIDRVAAVRDRCPTMRLMVDANQAYLASDALRVLRGIGRYDIDMIEQPVPAEDFEGLAYVRRRSEVPVEADESIRSVGDALRLIRMEAVDVMALKVGHLGGIGNAMRLASLCEAASIGCLIGANTGGRLAEAAHLHLAAAIPNLTYACELGEFYRLVNDPTGELECSDGSLAVPVGPGMGIGTTAAELFADPLPVT